MKELKWLAAVSSMLTLVYSATTYAAISGTTRVADSVQQLGLANEPLDDPVALHCPGRQNGPGD